jgi:mRNA-degrading endonuclease RelE of RelBE toxin-antitoxin system
MNIAYTEHALDDIETLPQQIRKAFFKQIRFLQQSLRHPSLRAKKYDEATDKWQARVTGGWRFYFSIVGDTYIITSVTPHPK